MSQSVVRFGGTLVVGLAALFLTAESSQGAGHGGGGHGGGGHGGGFHGGGFHGGGFHGGGFRGGWGGFRGGFHGGGWSHYARGFRGGWGGFRGGWYGYRGYSGGYWPWLGYGYWGYPGYSYWGYPAYSYSGYPSGGYIDYSSEPSYYTDTPVYTSALSSTSGLYAATPAADDTARVTVRVPSDAQVWIQNQPTTQRGSVRHFQSPQLIPGQEYTYDIRAQWREGGRVVGQTRHVDVQAGSSLSVDFTAPTANQRQASADAVTSGS